MNKQRLEAFSDGVFAIVITLLILNIHVPDVPAASLGHALLQQLPQVFTYVLVYQAIRYAKIANPFAAKAAASRRRA